MEEGPQSAASTLGKFLKHQLRSRAQAQAREEKRPTAAAPCGVHACAWVCSSPFAGGKLAATQRIGKMQVHWTATA